MEEGKRQAILNVFNHFRGKPVNQKVLTEYCNFHKIIPVVTLGDFKDFVYQAEHDEAVSRMFPEILKELQNLQYESTFITDKERDAIRENNDNVRVNVTKLFEDNAIDYKMADPAGVELGNMIGGVVATAGTTAFNKALNVLLHLARKEFGCDFNMKNASEYAKKMFDKTEKENIKE